MGRTFSVRLSTCKRCGRKITWRDTRAGKKMPCDPDMFRGTGRQERGGEVPDAERGYSFCRPGVWRSGDTAWFCPAFRNMREGTEEKYWIKLKFSGGRDD